MKKALVAVIVLTAFGAAPAGAADTPQGAVTQYFKSSAQGDLAGMKRATTGTMRRSLDQKTPQQLWVNRAVSMAFSRVGRTTITGDRATVYAHFNKHELSEKSFPAVLANLLSQQKDPAKKKKLARIMMALKPLIVKRLALIKCTVVRIDGQWLLEKSTPAKPIGSRK